MTVSALVIAGEVSSGGVSAIYEFAAIPRVGETVVIIERGLDLTIEVTSVVHLPSGGETIEPCAKIHVWGSVLDHGYQY